MYNQNDNQIIGYDVQTGQPIYANQNQMQTNDNIYCREYANQNNFISEKLKKCRKTLHNDSIVLMIVSIIAMILGILFIGSDEESAMDLFMESLFYFIFLIIIVCNRKEFKKFVGALAIIVSSFMILFAIFNHSIFDIIYFILSVFYIIHAISYLKNIKGYMSMKEQEKKLKMDKLKYISLILIIMCFVYPIVNLIFANIESNILIVEPLIIVFAFAVASLILNIILLVKKRKSALVYVCLVFSILIILIAGILIPN